MKEHTVELVESVRPFLPDFLQDPRYDPETVLGSVLILYIAETHPHLRSKIALALMRGQRDRLRREEGV